jgi:hypothetical protein
LAAAIAACDGKPTAAATVEKKTAAPGRAAPPAPSAPAAA